MQQDKKRIFFGFDINSPWPEKVPEGKILKESNRHLTLVFLGGIDFKKMNLTKSHFPKPPMRIGLMGIFDNILFLPKEHPRVCAYHVSWISYQEEFLRYQKELVKWCESCGFVIQDKEFLSHVTVARAPFNQREWEKFFHKGPLSVHHLHLYESLGHSEYRSLWHYTFLPAIEPLPHTADIAYLVRGETLYDVYKHAQMALAFEYPQMVEFFDAKSVIQDIDEIIILLNEQIVRADIEYGCPFKAVSFHSEIEEKQGIIQWEMIVDV